MRPETRRVIRVFLGGTAVFPLAMGCAAGAALMLLGRSSDLFNVLSLPALPVAYTAEQMGIAPGWLLTSQNGWPAMTAGGTLFIYLGGGIALLLGSLALRGMPDRQ